MEAAAFVERVKHKLTDGGAADRVRQHVKKSEAEKRTFADLVLDHSKPNDAAGQERSRLSKERAGMAHRRRRPLADSIDSDERRR